MRNELFAILQKYDFSSKSQLEGGWNLLCLSCLRYCKSTIFQANHNEYKGGIYSPSVVCDTAKVRFFKQITTSNVQVGDVTQLFAILQKYDFSSKSQRIRFVSKFSNGCLRYCKSTIFQANHNWFLSLWMVLLLFAILQKYDFSSKSQQAYCGRATAASCLRYCKSTIFQANHNLRALRQVL